MKKILILDPSSDGHHWFYNFNILNSIKNNYEIYYYTCKVSEEQKIKLQSIGITCKVLPDVNYANVLIRNIETFKVIASIKKEAKKNKIDILMFLHLDSMVLQTSQLLFNNFKIISTLHWMPKQKIKKILLKLYLINKNHRLVVHDDLIKQSINNKNNRINIIYYPISDDENFIQPMNIDAAKSKIGITNESPTILCFGGTRYDKGLDILLESIKYIKHNFNLVIAGKEEYFKKEFILNKISELNMDKERVILNLSFISEEDMKLYFKACDIVAIPYRKDFMGQSGPLTEGIKNNCITIAPDWYVVGQTVRKYKCGLLFNPEDPLDLADKIDDALLNINKIRVDIYKGCIDFCKDRSLEFFLMNYKNIIQQVLYSKVKI